MAPTKHCTNAVFQKLRSVRQGPDQTAMSFGANIVVTCAGTDITDYNKRIFFWTRLRPEIRAAIRKGNDYLTFDACLDAGVEAETTLYLDAEHKKDLKSAPKDKAEEKAGKGKGKARDDPLESRITQDALQYSRSGFCGHGCSRGRGGHGHYPQGNGSGALGPGGHQRSGNCKACGKPGHWAQDCRTNPPTNSASSLATTAASSKPK